METSTLFSLSSRISETFQQYIFVTAFLIWGLVNIACGIGYNETMKTQYNELILLMYHSIFHFNMDNYLLHHSFQFNFICISIDFINVSCY